MSDNNSTVGGIGLLGATFLVFLILKLCKVIDWSWWWVTAPLWGVFALLIVIIGIAAVVLWLIEVLP